MNYGDLHYLLLLAFNRSNKAIVRQTAKGDLLPGQPKILEFLWEHPDCTQKRNFSGMCSGQVHCHQSGCPHGAAKLPHKNP